MPKETVIEFYEALRQSAALKQQSKAITTIEEMIKMASKYGYCFNSKDISEANGSETPKKGEELIAIESSETNGNNFPQQYHYEYEFSQMPEFGEIAQQFEKLKIKPSTVDMAVYEKSFREEDLQFADVSPTAPDFQQRYLESLRSYMDLGVTPQPEYAWQQFHLINLDRHVEHPLYEEYFQAKVRLLELFESYFGTEVRFSGSLWYPPNAYRMWHTNETQPGWRMYLVDFDKNDINGDEKSFFRYMDPETKELVTLGEKPKLVRFFKVESEKSKLFWHCIVNRTSANRWSFGFQISSQWMKKVLKN
jgi:hypothetical protein